MIVVAPLGYTRTAWYGAPNLLARGNVTVEGRRSEADCVEVLALVRREFKIGKVYAYGWSMGGAGALHLALKHRIFAAIAVVAPNGRHPRENRALHDAQGSRRSQTCRRLSSKGGGRSGAGGPTRRLVADMRGILSMQARYVEEAGRGP